MQLTTASPGADGQRAANDALWRSRQVVRAYTSRTLRPVEAIVLARHRERFAGRVLELGCGAGRLTGYLAELAESVRAIDINPYMITVCGERYPAVQAEVGDLRDLSRFENGSFDTVVAAYAVLDVLDDRERREALSAVRRILRPGGTLLFSTHNRASAARRTEPLRLRGKSPRAAAATLVRLPLWQRNRRRVVAHEREERDYAILNDISHRFAALHYYIARDAQERQLDELGFELDECLDLDGHPVGPGEAAAHSPELHYLAHRRPNGG